MYATEESIANIGRQIRAFHEATKKFPKAHPKEYEDMQTYDELWNGMLSKIEPLNIPKTDETWGIMHGDLHEGNFLVDPNNNNKITLFDWDITSKSWLAVDVGTMVCG